MLMMSPLYSGQFLLVPKGDRNSKISRYTFVENVSRTKARSVKRGS